MVGYINLVFFSKELRHRAHTVQRGDHSEENLLYPDSQPQ